MEGIVKIHGVIGEIKDADGSIQTPFITLKDVIQQVESQKLATSLTVDINSIGGLVEEADEIYDYLESVKARGVFVNTRTSKVCASAATKVFLVGQKREIVGHPEFMIHNPFGQPKGGDADYIEAYYKALRGLENDYIAFYSKITGTSKEAIKPLMKKETYLSPEEAVSFGFATVHTPAVELQAVAYSNKLNLKTDEMSKNNSQEVDAKTDSILDKIKALLNGKEKPQAKLVQDSNGAEIDFTELADDDTPAVGNKATVEGSPAEGEYVMPSGETFVFAGGELTEIRPSEETSEEEVDVEALKAENAALKEQLEAQSKKTEEADTQVVALKKELETNQSGLQDIQKEIKALKSTIGSSFSHEAEKENFEKEKPKARKI